MALPIELNACMPIILYGGKHSDCQILPILMESHFAKVTCYTVHNLCILWFAVISTGEIACIGGGDLLVVIFEQGGKHEIPASLDREQVSALR